MSINEDEKKHNQFGSDNKKFYFPHIGHISSITIGAKEVQMMSQGRVTLNISINKHFNLMMNFLNIKNSNMYLKLLYLS